MSPEKDSSLVKLSLLSLVSLNTIRFIIHCRVGISKIQSAAFFVGDFQAATLLSEEGVPHS